jgi:hypothetical protein
LDGFKNSRRVVVIQADGGEYNGRESQGARVGRRSQDPVVSN